MRLFVIRHGQTNWNLEGKMQGSTNIPLNETGIKQAEGARKTVNNLDIDLIICSTLDRAKQTAEIVNKDTNAPIIYDERIMERNYGEFEGESSKGINFREYLNYYDNKEIKGGETIQEFCKRVFGFLEEIEQRYKNKTILLSTHGCVSRAIECYYNGIPEDGDTTKFMLNNCEVREYKK